MNLLLWARLFRFHPQLASKTFWIENMPLLEKVFRGRGLLLFVLASCLLPLTAGAETPSAAAQDEEFLSKCPPASRLLPTDTLAYLRIRNTTDLKAGFARSSLGKMLDDPTMRPLVSDTYRTLGALLEQLASDFGLSLDELVAIPQGQVAIALVPGVPPEQAPQSKTRKEAAADADADAEEDTQESDREIARRLQRKRRQQNSFAGVFIIETGENNEAKAAMKKLLEQLSTLAAKNQFVRKDQSMDGHTLTQWKRPRGRGPTVEWFDREGVFVVGIGRRSAADVLQRWNQTDAPKNRKEAAEQSGDASTTALAAGGNLSSNPDFGAVMTRSVGAEAETPQITFFVNPFGIAQKIIRRSGSSFFILPIVEELGVKKIRGIGGSVFRGGELIENIAHIHIVIDPPRDGFFGILRPEPVAPSPPEWVPADVTNYLTASGNVATAFDNLTEVVDRFAGEGAFERFTEDRIQARLGVSLRDDLIANLTGRYVGIHRYQPPAAWNAAARLDALQVRDVDQAREMLQKIKGKLPAADMRPETIGSVQFYFLRRGRELSATLRRPERSVALMDDYLLIADSREIVEEVIKARGGTIDRLSDDADYALMVSELGAKLAGEKPFYLSFNRDAESYRVLYELATSPELSGALSQRGENSAVAKQFADLLKRQKLPSFDELKKYFNVSGSFGYDEPGGLHFGFMNLRPLQ